MINKGIENCSVVCENYVIDMNEIFAMVSASTCEEDSVVTQTIDKLSCTLRCTDTPTRGVACFRSVSLGYLLPSFLKVHRLLSSSTRCYWGSKSAR